MSSLFRQLRSGQGSSPSSGSQYAFQGGGSHPFRERPGTPSTTSKPTTEKRDSDGDRPSAYHPPAVQEKGVVTEWEPPTFTEILKDLGLRMLEVSIAAAALAVGEEIAYFFRKRRFYTEEQKQRGRW